MTASLTPLFPPDPAPQAAPARPVTARVIGRILPLGIVCVLALNLGWAGLGLLFLGPEEPLWETWSPGLRALVLGAAGDAPFLAAVPLCAWIGTRWLALHPALALLGPVALAYLTEAFLLWRTAPDEAPAATMYLGRGAILAASLFLGYAVTENHRAASGLNAMLHAIWSFFICVVLTIFWATLGILTWPLSPSGRLYLFYARAWSRMMLAACRVRLHVIGRENIEPRAYYVFMSNHQSFFDILALFRAVPADVRMMAKKSIRNVPILGWSMWMADFVFIDRENRGEAFQSIAKAAAQVRDRRQNVLIFPEGTRGDGETIRDFKKGGFVLAEAAKAPIIPIVLYGSSYVLPSGSIKVRPGRIVAVIGQPIAIPEGEPGEVRIQLMSAVRSAMDAQLVTARETWEKIAGPESA